LYHRLLFKPSNQIEDKTLKFKIEEWLSAYKKTHQGEFMDLVDSFKKSASEIKETTKGQ